LDTWNGFGNQMSALHIFCAVSFDKAFWSFFFLFVGWWGWQYFVEFLFLYPFIIPILCYVLNVHRRKKICSKYLSIAMFFFIETCPYIVAALCVLYIHTCI
jgi:hypothetical protein